MTPRAIFSPSRCPPHPGDLPWASDHSGLGGSLPWDPTGPAFLPSCGYLFLCPCLAGLRCGSALFRHEVGYVLGQLQHEAAVSELAATLARTTESPMVRHECAEALGAIARPDCLAALREHIMDPEQVVRESCEVALDMYEYENGQDFQYADALERLRPAP